MWFPSSKNSVPASEHPSLITPQSQSTEEFNDMMMIWLKQEVHVVQILCFNSHFADRKWQLQQKQIMLHLSVRPVSHQFTSAAWWWQENPEGNPQIRRTGSLHTAGCRAELHVFRCACSPLQRISLSSVCNKISGEITFKSLLSSDGLDILLYLPLPMSWIVRVNRPPDLCANSRWLSTPATTDSQKGSWPHHNKDHEGSSRIRS